MLILKYFYLVINYKINLSIKSLIVIHIHTCEHTILTTLRMRVWQVYVYIKYTQIYIKYFLITI